MIFGTPFEVAFDDAAPSRNYLSYSMESVMSNVPLERYNMDVLLKANPIYAYKMSCRMGLPTPGYLCDGIIVLDKNDPRLPDSFVNVYMWTFANEWRLAARAIEDAQYRMKLDFASSEDLDEQWGVMLGLRRRSGESDDSYRTRLSTHIRIITSSGTKENCQTIIDRITGAPGGSNLETFGNAEVVLSWTSPDAIIAARDKSDLIEEAMDRMFACGVSWSTSYPLLDYDFDGLIEGPVISEYNINGAISKLRGIQYRASTSLFNYGSKTYNIDSLLYSKGLKNYSIKYLLIKEPIKTYSMNGKLNMYTEFEHESYYYVDFLNSKNMKRSYMIGGILEAA